MGINPSVSEKRELTASFLPQEFRREVSLLGNLLGQIIAQAEGQALLEDVENLRRLVIEARESSDAERKAEGLVQSWETERALKVAQAFTCYFHLANLAEERNRARVIRNRRQAGELDESLESSVKLLAAQHDLAILRQAIDNLLIHPVLTAHPTESRRRAVQMAVRRISSVLDALDKNEISTDQGMELLKEEIDILWRTIHIRHKAPDPLDEVRSVLGIFEQSLFNIVPVIHRSLEHAVKKHGLEFELFKPFIRFGTWVGADRDGNPNVTAAVTLKTAELQRQTALRLLEQSAMTVGAKLTVHESTTPPSIGLKALLLNYRKADPKAYSIAESRSLGEPHRVAMFCIAERLRATRDGKKWAYLAPQEFISEVETVRNSLLQAGARAIANGQIRSFLWQAKTFGFHLAELEVRQHSAIHKAAIDDIKRGNIAPYREVLDTFSAIAEIQRRYGPDMCSRYIVSFTSSAQDISNLFELAKIACGTIPILDVVPLFETANDLTNAVRIADQIVNLPEVSQRLSHNGNRFEIMLGYSDSGKEIGPTAASILLYKTQEELLAWADKNKIKLTLFHGRGGSLGRGGGPANRAVLAQPPGSVYNGFKVTEQGEVIFARYGNTEIGLRHLEQVGAAVMESFMPDVQRRNREMAQKYKELAEQIAAASRAAYSRLVNSEGFYEWFCKVTPLLEIDKLKIGSRPARRGIYSGFEELRAIPWVFAWSQTRVNLAGWYGLGSGLAAVDMDQLRDAYRKWPFFSTLMDNAEMSLAKTDRKIAESYLALGGRPELTRQVLEEYDLTVQKVLEVTQHQRLLENRPVLSLLIELRNPYVDALSQLQLKVLREIRQGKAYDVKREQLLLLTINGIAAGLQNTG